MGERLPDAVTKVASFWRDYSSLIDDGFVVVDSSNARKMQPVISLFSSSFPARKMRGPLVCHYLPQKDGLRVLLADASRVELRVHNTEPELDVAALIGEGFEDITSFVLNDEPLTKHVFVRKQY